VKLDEKNSQQFISYPASQGRTGQGQGRTSGNRYSESSNDTDDALLSNWQEPFRKFDFNGGSPVKTTHDWPATSSRGEHGLQKKDIKPPAYHDLGRTGSSNAPRVKTMTTKQNGSHSAETQGEVLGFTSSREGGGPYAGGQMSSHRGYSSDSEDSQTWIERQRSKLQTSQASRHNRTAQERQLVAELRNSQANLAAQKLSSDRDWENLDSNNNYSGFANGGRCSSRDMSEKYSTLDNKQNGEIRRTDVQRSFSFTTNSGPTTLPRNQTLPRNHRLESEGQGGGRGVRGFEVEERVTQATGQRQQGLYFKLYD